MKKSQLSVLTSLVILAAALAAPASAQFPPGQKVSGFQPVDDYILSLDGMTVDAARIYSNSSPAILLMASDLQAPVVIWPRSRSVESVNLLKVARNDNGTVDILPDPVLAPQGSFEIVNGMEVHFAVEGKQAVLKPRPPVLGLHDVAGMRRNSVKYSQLADYYSPNAPTIANLRSAGQDVRVRVFFGSWCPACGQLVPRIMKVAEQLAETNVDFEFYGLPRNISSDPEASRMGITGVPTGVVFVDGREAGRISGGDHWTVPENRIRDILAGS